MTLSFQALSFDVDRPEEVGAFWAGMLGRAPVPESGGVLLPGRDAEIGLRFEVGSGPHSDRKVHLHLTSRDAADQQAVVDRALSAGARSLDVGQRPEEGYVVLADPAGTAICVIEPGNRFLADSGFLAEVALDGGRSLGLFWAATFDWPLVWDRDGETAVQSPYGGTKLAWGGESMTPRRGRNRQRFDLLAADPDAEAERLLSLGARRLGTEGRWQVLTDPEDNELRLTGR